MTHPTPDLDDLLRQALRAEAHDNDADPELLDRIRTAVTSRPRWQGGARLLTAAALVAVVVGVASLLLARDDDPARIDTVDDPTATTNTTSAASTPSSPPSGTPRPDVIALVREDGMLVVVDLTTGTERELYSVGDPRDVPKEGGPYYIDAVELSPDGKLVYFSTCCEPASGNTYRIPVSGGEPELIAVGASPRISPDGRWLATGAGEQLIVTRLGGAAPPASVQVPCCTRSQAWSPDGARLALVTTTGASKDNPRTHVYAWDGERLSIDDFGGPDVEGGFVGWGPDGSLRTYLSPATDRTVSQDRSYRWALWVDADGAIRWGEDRDVIEGLPRVIAADW